MHIDRKDKITIKYDYPGRLSQLRKEESFPTENPIKSIYLCSAFISLDIV
jgi:hypothetical protein